MVMRLKLVPTGPILWEPYCQASQGCCQRYACLPFFVAATFVKDVAAWKDSVKAAVCWTDDLPDPKTNT